MGKAVGLGRLRAEAWWTRQGGRRHRVCGAGLRAAGETSRKDPWDQRSRLGPGLKGLTGYCTHERMERSRAGDHRSALDLRKVSERQGHHEIPWTEEPGGATVHAVTVELDMTVTKQREPSR